MYLYPIILLGLYHSLLEIGDGTSENSRNWNEYRGFQLAALKKPAEMSMYTLSEMLGILVLGNDK